MLFFYKYGNFARFLTLQDAFQHLEFAVTSSANKVPFVSAAKDL